MNYYSPIPYEKRVFTLAHFVRTHMKEKIVILCYGIKTVEFLARYFMELNMTPCKITGNMQQKQRDNTIRLFSEDINILLISQNIAQNVQLPNVDWLVEYAIPPAVADFIKLVKNINAKKTLLFLDPENEIKFVEKLKEAKFEFKELPFDAKKIPDGKLNLLKLLDKIYDFYMSSQFGYREMVQAYVNSENPEFDALKLRLKDASMSYGIEHPPKLPLTK